MSNNDTRTLLERACAKAVDIMLSGDDVATVRQATSHHVVIIRTVESDEREARTIQRREEHAERTKQDTERELSRVVDELAHVRAEGAQALEDATAALVAAESRIAVEANRAAEMEAQANAEKARADAAEQRVCELQEKANSLRHEVDILTDGEDNPRRHVTYADGRPVVECEWKKPLRAAADDVRAALSRTEAVAGRWVPRAKYDEVLAHMGDAEASRKHLSRVLDDMHKQRDDAWDERDAAIARAEKAEADNAVLQQVIQSDATQLRAAIAARDEAVARRDAEVRAHYAAIDDRDEAFTEATAASRRASEAERARDEVGIQLAAAQAEIARMQGRLSDAVALLLANNLGCVSDALGVLRRRDAVPGDALTPKLTAALEASGIDASNVKGGE